MPRKSSGPWYWILRKQWVVNIRGKRHYLGPEKEAAEQEYHRLMSVPEPTPVRWESVVVLFDKFLEWCQKHRSASTYEWYSQRLNEFAPRVAILRVDQLKPFHVQDWIDTKNSSGHQRGCMTAVQRAMNWSVKQGYIDRNPIRHMEKPEGGRRERCVSTDEYSVILKHASDQEFRDIVTFCWETGARPQEVFQMEARHFDDVNQRVVIPKSEAKGKRKVRIIYLTDKALEIVRRLVRTYPKGKIMRNADGIPWQRNNIACRFARMKKHLGRKATLYELRHSYVTRKLLAGVDSHVVATLAGHTSLNMIHTIYSHVAHNQEFLLQQARREA